MTEIIEVLHKISANPWVYDKIQTLAGQKQSFQRICRRTAELRAETVVDLGAGTGIWHRLWPAGCRYVCLDIEMRKLRRFRSKVPVGLAVLSDATRMPIATGSADVVTCFALMHHLGDAMVDQVFDESLRVLRDGGHVIMLDPVLNRKRWEGRILWRLDRGAYPRTAGDLRKRLEAKFTVVHWESFAVYHEYAFGIGVRPYRTAQSDS